ncbi:hypothetical protein AGMMS50256_35940 [Betaproteobacteria bacterium]|nr:hypothetical protein AGMMS50256_35940 [Betaproteobacteria bacterium]
MNNTARALVAGLALSAAGLVYIAADESYTNQAIRPVPGDKPTYGFGSTVKADGSPVRMGDTITPPAALVLAARDIAMKEGALKACMGDVLLTQYEYDAIVSLAYNVGPSAVCQSSIPAKFRVGDYEAACKTILDFSKFCSKPKIKNAAGKWVCPPGALKPLKGLENQRQREYRLCISGIRNQESGINPKTSRSVLIPDTWHLSSGWARHV